MSKPAGDSTAYINAVVYTLDISNPRASGFIVSDDGFFTHVGSTHDILSVAKESRLVIVDLKGCFTMPGIHDAHMHLLFSGLGLTSNATIDMDATHLNIAEKVKHGNCACEYINVYQDWLLASAYNNQGFPDGIADRKYLDKLFPDQPVVVSGGAAHAMLLNTAALIQAGYDVDNEPDTHGAKFFRRPDGSLTGELAESAMAKVALAIPAPSRSHVKRALKHAIRLAHKAGVTSTQEASSNTILLQVLNEMEREGSLRLDVSTHIVHENEWLASESTESLQRLLEVADQHSSKHIDTRFVKVMMDGVPLPPLFTHAGLNEQGDIDHSMIIPENVADAILKYDKKGLTVKIHCTGNGATRHALNAIEAARKSNPDGPRHEIAHNSGVHDDDFQRYAPLNVTAEMSPAELFVHPVTAGSQGLMDWNFTKMMDAGAHITIGSDWGAVPDPSLFEHMANIVDVVGRGDRSAGGEALCRMMTLNGAMAVGREKELGSIEIGKKANFIVTSQDLSKGEFKGAKVIRTYFEGERVWDANVG
ncbi:putative exoenzymes regulatory protein aepA precursor [Boeremia exigua]|uniref:putative exoenzymes regulatory protein aepA precursor n=1 Tax=Boeremia exigua TaxID=749465 RepID=UPI001E8D82CE|nr:putative exoenzymes regulatory protein aepA precursor [Boeremia exigua]KAH6643928.1 putative exoenzymes regulatory protein aepA precursor [Boeremia exigua]